MNKRVTVLPLLLFATTIFAQEIATEEVAEVRRYTVEIIIFRYAQDVSSATEIFVADRPAADALDGDILASDVVDDERDLPAIEQGAVALPRRHYEVVRLAVSDFTMGEIYDHIRRLDVYQPLMHFGWTQQTLPEDESEARPLSSFAAPPTGLAGSLNLYLSRYLHLDVDLKLDAPNTGVARSAYEISDPIRYHIDENRILRNGELRYFDHPKFGVLAKVVRVEDDDDAELVGYDRQ